MHHRRRTKYFSRKFNARKALFRGLIVSLVEHERICTTIVKAKEIRRHVEKAITLGRDNSVAIRRLLLTDIPHQETVEKILSNISPRFKDRPGGYTRIIKLDRRPGDKAEMAFLEFVDYDYTKAAQKPAELSADDKKAVAKKSKLAVAAAARHRKNVRAIKNKSRQENRA